MAYLSGLKNIIQKINVELIPENYSTGTDYDGKLIQDKNGRIYKYDAAKGKYISETVENLLKQYTTSETEFKARQKANRKKYAGSGFVEVTKKYSRLDYINSGGLAVWKRQDVYFGGSNNQGSKLYLGDITTPNYENPVFNINGVLLKIHNFDYFGQISLPKPTTSLFTIKDSTSLNENMKQGDFAILKDLDRNLIPSMTEDDWDGERCSDADEGVKIEVTNTDYESVNVMYKTITKKNIPKDIKIKIRVKLDFGTADYINFDYWGCDNGNIDIHPDMVDDNGWYEFEIINNQCGVAEYLFGFHPNFGSDISTDDYCYIRDLQVYQVEEQPIVAIQDVDKDIDIYENADKFEARDSVSRQDLVFLETWEEKVTEKDIVYPYGNTQYRGGNIKGLSGIADGNFDGADTYSLFGNWQNAGELVGKGYKWSDLSIEDRIKFVSNPENNVYLSKDGEFIQVRYRIRVVKGLGNKWHNVATYGSRIGYDNDLAGLMIKGGKTEISSEFMYSAGGVGDKYIYFGSDLYNFHYDKNGLWHGFKNYNINNLALPIALVQRPNDGIYHPTFNPMGTGKYYYKNGDNSAIIEWYELGTSDYPVNDDNQLDLEAMFDPEHISMIKDDSISNLANADDTYFRIGTIECGLTAHPAGRFADEINEMDVEDLRMSAHKKPLEEIHNIEKLKDITGERRGKEYQLNGRIKIVKVVDKSIGSNCDIRFKDTDDTLAKGKLLKAFNLTSGIRYNSDYLIEIRGSSSHTSESENNYFNYINFDNGHSANQTNVGDIIVLYYDANFISGTHNYNYHFPYPVCNNTYIQTDIIGDPRKLSDRIEYTVTDTDETIDIHKNMYIKCEDSDNNKGKEGHLYRYLGKEITGVHTNSNDGDANDNGGHIDFSDDEKWLDLGDDLSIGGYPELWVNKGFAGTPLIVGENGESLLPIDVETTYTGCYSDNPYLRFKASKKITGFRTFFVMKKDGTYEKWHNNDVGGSCPNWDHDDAIVNPCGGNVNIKNTHNIVLNDSYAKHLGYSSEQEMLDLMKVIVIYKAKANFMELANNSKVLDVSRMAEKGYSSDINEGVFITSNLINKIPTNNGMGVNVCGRNFSFTTNEYGNLGSYKTMIAENDTFDFSNSTHMPQIKQFTFLTQKNNRLFLQYVFKELKYDEETKTWGDDDKFQITNKVSTTTDTNGNKVLYGQKRVSLPYFYSEE